MGNFPGMSFKRGRGAFLISSFTIYDQGGVALCWKAIISALGLLLCQVSVISWVSCGLLVFRPTFLLGALWFGPSVTCIWPHAECFKLSPNKPGLFSEYNRMVANRFSFCGSAVNQHLGFKRFVGRTI